MLDRGVLGDGRDGGGGGCMAAAGAGAGRGAAACMLVGGSAQSLRDARAGATAGGPNGQQAGDEVLGDVAGLGGGARQYAARDASSGEKEGAEKGRGCVG